MVQLLISPFNILIVTRITVTWITHTDIFIDPLKTLFYHNLHIAKWKTSQQAAYLQTRLCKSLTRAAMYWFCIKTGLSSNLCRNSSYTDLRVLVVLLRHFRHTLLLLLLYLDISHSGFSAWSTIWNSSIFLLYFMIAANTLKGTSEKGTSRLIPYVTLNIFL
jgi:hypothetical protein